MPKYFRKPTHAYDVSVQFGAEIWATAKTEKKIKSATSFTTPSRISDISYSTALRVDQRGLARKNWARQPRHLKASFYTFEGL